MEMGSVLQTFQYYRVGAVYGGVVKACKRYIRARFAVMPHSFRYSICHVCYLRMINSVKICRFLRFDKF